MRRYSAQVIFSKEHLYAQSSSLVCRLADVVGLADPPTVSAQLAPLNFVYTGSGSQSDALKFSYEAGFFRKRGLDLTMLYVTSGITTSQTIVSGAASAATTTATDALRAIAAGAPMKIIMVNIDQFQHLFIARPENQKRQRHGREEDRGEPLRRLLRYPNPLCRPPMGHGSG